LIRSQWLCKKRNRKVALKLVPRPRAKRVDFEVVEGVKSSQVGSGTIARGSASCPLCGYTTPVAAVREQLKPRHGGASDARMLCVVSVRPDQQGRLYRTPTKRDLRLAEAARSELKRRRTDRQMSALLPDEQLDIRGIRHTWAMLYGLDRWSSFFAPRQLLVLTTLTRLIRGIRSELSDKSTAAMGEAIQTCLAFALDKLADLGCSLTAWKPDAECPVHMCARQAIPMLWDFAEPVYSSGASGSWESMVQRTAYSLDAVGVDMASTGNVIAASADSHPLPDVAQKDSGKRVSIPVRKRPRAKGPGDRC